MRTCSILIAACAIDTLASGFVDGKSESEIQRGQGHNDSIIQIVGDKIETCVCMGLPAAHIEAHRLSLNGPTLTPTGSPSAATATDSRFPVKRSIKGGLLSFICFEDQFEECFSPLQTSRFFISVSALRAYCSITVILGLYNISIPHLLIKVLKQRRSELGAKNHYFNY